jgi:hypothetical protein
MPVVEQYKTSTLGLKIRHGVEPKHDLTAHTSFWGFRDSSNINSDPYLSQFHGEGFDIKPDASKLFQLGYSVDGTPNMILVSFGDTNAGSTLKMKTPSMLDELDINAPNNTKTGTPSPNGGSVVSQIYKSPSLEQYRSKGPKDGRY